MDQVVLEYEHDDFLARAVALIRAREPFFFAVRDPAFSLLRPMIKDAKFVDLPKLGLVPKLQPLMGVVTFAKARGMQVLLDEHDDMIGVLISVVRN
jgi:hypothetical protein